MQRVRPSTIRLGAALCAGLAAAALAPPAGAEDEVKKLEVPEQEYVIGARDDARRPGLDWKIATGATLTFSDNRSVVGQPDGATLLFGFKLDGFAHYNRGAHESRTTVTAGAGLARTPLIDEIVKARDSLDIESIYLFHVLAWFGPYGRFVLGTAMFRGADVRPEVTTYRIAGADGAASTVVAERLVLTDPFRPLLLKQSLGPFVRPLVRDEVNVEIRAGLGARETFADGQRAIADDAATAGVVEVKALSDVLQIGAEVAAEVWGATSDKRVVYRVTLEAMTPFAHTALAASDDRGALELTNLGLSGALSFKLVGWASLDYEVRAVRDPQLLDEFQVQNNLLLTFGLTASNLPPEASARGALRRSASDPRERARGAPPEPRHRVRRDHEEDRVVGHAVARVAEVQGGDRHERP